MIEYKKNNINTASKLFEKACVFGDMRSCYEFGLMEYRRGNIAKGEKLYKKACADGYQHACNISKIITDIDKINSVDP